MGFSETIAKFVTHSSDWIVVNIYIGAKEEERCTRVFSEWCTMLHGIESENSLNRNVIN